MRGNRRIVWLLAAIAVSFILAGMTLYLFVPTRQFSKAKYDRIQIGMTRADVERLLGFAGIYGYGFDAYAGRWEVQDEWNWNSPKDTCDWLSEDSAINIDFDGEDRVRGKRLR